MAGKIHQPVLSNKGSLLAGFDVIHNNNGFMLIDYCSTIDDPIEGKAGVSGSGISGSVIPAETWIRSTPASSNSLAILILSSRVDRYPHPIAYNEVFIPNSRECHGLSGTNFMRLLRFRRTHRFSDWSDLMRTG